MHEDGGALKDEQRTESRCGRPLGLLGTEPAQDGASAKEEGVGTNVRIVQRYTLGIEFLRPAARRQRVPAAWTCPVF